LYILAKLVEDLVSKMGLTSWPETALRRRHVGKVADEEAMVELLLALEANACPAIWAWVCIYGVNAEGHDLRVRINGVEAQPLCIGLALVSDLRRLSSQHFWPKKS
jgi:hypothetical protein